MNFEIPNTLVNGAIADANEVMENFDYLNAILDGLPDGSLLNGKISPTVANNGITLSLLTQAGNTPSATDTVYAKLNGVWYAITSALTVSIAQSTTNPMRLGSTEFTGLEVDLFACLVYDTVGTAVRLGFTRYPNDGTYANYSSTVTSEKYLALSGGTPASTDTVHIIGRFAATVTFATPNYNWSVPTYTHYNLKQEPIKETRWLDWLAVIVIASSGTSPTYTANFQNKYKMVGSTLYFDQVWNNASGGTAGNGSGRFYSSLPFANANYVGDRSMVGIGYMDESAGTTQGVWLWQDSGPSSPLSAASAVAYRFTGTTSSAVGNDQSSTTRFVQVNGRYRI